MRTLTLEEMQLVAGGRGSCGTRRSSQCQPRETRNNCGSTPAPTPTPTPTPVPPVDTPSVD
ncbi:MAG: hypothetical protein ACKVOT_15145 [Polaromonas sp.]